MILMDTEILAKSTYLWKKAHLNHVFRPLGSENIRCRTFADERMLNKVGMESKPFRQNSGGA